MKRLYTALLLTMVWAMTWADSPLTSTDFSKAYADNPMVQLALQYHGQANPALPEELLDFLCDANSPIDERLATLSAISWNIDGTTVGNQLLEQLLRRNKTADESKLIKKLDAKTLAVYAYAVALSDYFNVEHARELAHIALQKDKNRSFCVALITALIDAQYCFDDNWDDIYPTVNKVVYDGSLRIDINQYALNYIRRYINIYKTADQ